MLKDLVGISKEHKSGDGNAYVIDTRIWERHFPITSDLKFDALKAIQKKWKSLENIYCFYKEVATFAVVERVEAKSLKITCWTLDMIKSS